MATTGRSEISVWAVIFWGGFQAFLLAVICGKFQFWAHHPVPTQSIAVPVMLIGQLLVGTLFVGAIFSNTLTATANLLLLVAFDSLAGFFADASPGQIFNAALFATAWLGGSAAWVNIIIPSRRSAAVTALTLIIYGGPLLTYLGLESNSSAEKMARIRSFSILGVATDLLTGGWGTRDIVWAFVPTAPFLACLAWRFTPVYLRLTPTVLHRATNSIKKLE